MASHDSIRTDASTVHRASDTSSSLSAPNDDVAVRPAPPPDVGQIAEAKTVIRGSSQVDGNLRSLGGTPASVAQVLQGKHLDHFLLEEMIGGGGMGAVFRAHDEQLDRIVAIKVIPFVGEDVDLRRRFRNEAQSAAKLDHPRIASIYGVGHRGDWHYIVFEYIHGTNIRDLVTNGGFLSIDDAVYYTCELAAALQHAADRGIVHRDIKPSNVLIGSDNNVKLVDMGLSRSEHLELSEDMTASGVTLGTFDYISPEQAHDPRDADLRSDLYSLGCTLYFMLTGSPPYPGGTMLQKLLNHGNSPPPNPRDLRPEVSDDLAAVIQRMLAKDPNSRYQNANDLISDLRTVSYRDGLIRAQGTRAVVVQQPSAVLVWLERHAPWLVAVTLLLVTAVWLQLSSAQSREEFSLTPSPYAEPPLRSEFDAEGTGLPDVGNRRPSGSIGDAADSDWVPKERDTSAAVPDSDPPSLPIPIPSELESDTMSIIERELPDDDAELDSSSGVSEEMEFRLDDPDVIEPLIGDAVIAPRVIQVLGQREGIDLLADPLERYEDGVLLSPSLSEAVELAERYGTDHIEIASPLIYSEPVTIKSDGLLITSTVAGGSVVAFRPKDIATMEPAKMLTIGSSRVDMDDLHFVWDVSPGLVEGGALVRINDNRLIHMTDCSITINNPASVDEVYAFDVVTDPEAIDWSYRDTTLRDDDTLQLVAIELDNVIIRGQMTMVHMDYATELQLQWDNGLLAISERMIDTAGTRIDPPLTSGPMQLSLTRLTAQIPLGLIRMRLGVSGQFPIVIDRESRHSVFVVDQDRPYAEVLGLKSLSSQPSLLKLRGEANVYVTEEGLYEPMLSRRDQERRNDVTKMSEMSASAPPWFTEASHRRSVRWSSGRLASKAPNRMKPSNFRQDGTALSGFDEPALPQLPEIVPAATDIDSRAESAFSGDLPPNALDF